MKRTAIGTALAAALLAGLLPAGSASADHCFSGFFLFHSYRTTVQVDDEEATVGNPTVTSSAIGCDVVGEEEPNTDIVYPATNSFTMRVREAEPVSASVTFAGETYTVDGFTLSDSGWWDSGRYFYDFDDSFDGGDMVATVCYDVDDCVVRVYRTLQ